VLVPFTTGALNELVNPEEPGAAPLIDETVRELTLSVENELEPPPPPPPDAGAKKGASGPAAFNTGITAAEPARRVSPKMLIYYT
jgi:hypothetical protein